jgi:hypothetical protein
MTENDTAQAVPAHRPLRRPEALRALFADPARASELVASSEAAPEAAIRQLAQFRLLYGLPFNVLVPDARMLPPESIRFFFLDDNWLDALADGVLSTVIRPGAANALLPLLRPLLQEAVAADVGRERTRRLEAAVSGGSPRAMAATRASVSPGPADPPTAEEHPVICGFLLRSTAVADWPGLRVRGFTDEDPDTPLDLLRMDRLAPTVLLALFDGVPERVVLDTPVQNPGFGVRPADDHPGRRQVMLRGLGGRCPVGEQVPGQAPVPVPMRPGSRDGDVVDIAKLYENLAEALRHAYVGGPVPPLRPAGVALQLIDSGSTQYLIRHPSGRSDDEY